MAVDTLYVIVSGPPASGKSTLAPALGIELGLPVIAKDVIKEALLEELDVPDIAASRDIGRGAIKAMWAIATASPVGAVIESNFHRPLATGDIAQLPGHVVEVFCRCDRATALDRYRSRAASRHRGHFDSTRTADELWNSDVCEPVAGGWPVVEVDTNNPVDPAHLANRLRAANSGTFNG